MTVVLETSENAALSVRLIGLVLMVFGALVMWGWEIESLPLVLFHRDSAPMQFNTALCFFLCGGVLLCMPRKGVYLALLCVLLLALLTLLQYATGESVGIDQFFVTHFTPLKTAHRGRMALSSAAAFVVAAGSMGAGLLWPRTQALRLLNMIAGGMVMMMGAVGAIGFFTGNDITFALGSASRMAIHTAIGFVLLGAALTHHWRTKRHDNTDGLAAGAPQLVASVVLIFALVCWFVLMKEGGQNIKNRVTKEAGVLQTAMLNHFELREHALQRLALRWKVQAAVPRELWARGARTYLEQYKDFQAIEFIDPEYNVEQKYSLSDESAASVFDVKIDAPSRGGLEAAVKERRPTMTQVINLDREEALYRIVVPTFSQDKLLGFVAGTFRVKNTMDLILRDFSQDTVIEVKTGKNVIYRSQYQQAGILSPYESVVSFDRTLVWRLFVWPNDKVLEEARTSLPEAALILGFLFACLAGLVTYYYQDAQAKTQKLSVANLVLERQAEELKRSNAELEHFAYVASHDLQEPLRKIANFAELLQNRYQEKLDEKGEKYIFYITDGAKRLQGLIRDLLTYARIGQGALKSAPEDMNVIVSDVLSDLGAAIQESAAEVSVAKLPTVTADKGHMRQLFQNLISNALKYRGKQAPKIQIGAEKIGAEWIFTVKDNGIGIDPKYAERIFVVFQRLHTSAEYAGTGIGLAICKKIVERCGGRIWVESKEGEGAAFRFTLPVL